jgi:hypothetical protein
LHTSDPEGVPLVQVRDVAEAPVLRLRARATEQGITVAAHIRVEHEILERITRERPSFATPRQESVAIIRSSS